MSIELDRLSLALGLGPSAQRIIEPLVALYQRLDAAVSEGASGLALPCRAGCDACCHESVFLSAPEFLLVAGHLASTRSRSERDQIVSEMRRLAEKFADELEQLELFPEGAERDEVAARIEFRCPLLSAEGGCTVYPVRELNGRTFGQSQDAGRAYGCELTHGRLRVLPPEAGRRLFDARAARRELAEALPGTEKVRVYPWWFARYGELI